MAARTRAEWGLFVLRAVVGIIFLMHGIPKLTGGVGQVAEGFAGLGIPMPLLAAWFITLLEIVGGASLILGLFTEIWNVLFIAEMATGIALIHWEQGFYVVGPGQGGYEFNLLLIAANLCLLLAGPGAVATQGGRRRRI
jgi:putative oxidoreductase